MQVKKQQLELDMEQQTGSELGKEYIKAIYCHPAYLTSGGGGPGTASGGGAGGGESGSKGGGWNGYWSDEIGRAHV